jgi:hypothetical protein
VSCERLNDAAVAHLGFSLSPTAINPCGSGSMTLPRTMPAELARSLEAGS